ncbi:hypothetical protein [uncultured Marixanthomonas sp.]|uniref:hypothetical protein n=1 Tax=uncultured Marixanthomonas sp. TaxID=757245 RepID=UPI0030D96FF4|tara:strand:+ start:97219 stop:97413 length:195 start_codon:yes stop_codon:yes gene_type:complete
MNLQSKLDEIEVFASLIINDIELLKREIEKEEAEKDKKSKEGVDKHSYDLLVKARAKRAKSRLL